MTWSQATSFSTLSSDPAGGAALDEADTTTRSLLPSRSRSTHRRQIGCPVPRASVTRSASGRVSLCRSARGRTSRPDLTKDCSSAEPFSSLSLAPIVRAGSAHRPAERITMSDQAPRMRRIAGSTSEPGRCYSGAGLEPGYAPQAQPGGVRPRSPRDPSWEPDRERALSMSTTRLLPSRRRPGA